MADTVFIDGQGFSVAKEKQADFVASKTFKSSRRRPSSSGGGGKSTPQTPTPSADKLVGSSADREAQIAAFRSGGQAAFNQKVAETKTRIQQAEIAQQKQQTQQRRLEQEKKRVVTSLKRLERGEITQFQFKTEQGTVTVRDRGEAAEIRQSIEEEGQKETVKEERIGQKKLKSQVNKAQVPTSPEKEQPFINPRRVIRSSYDIVNLGFKALGFKTISAPEKQQLISQELKPLSQAKTPKQQQIEIGKLQAKGINVTSTKQGYNIDTSKIVPTSKVATIARNFIAENLLFAGFSPALTTTAGIASKNIKITKTNKPKTKFISRIFKLPEGKKFNKVVQVISESKVKGQPKTTGISQQLVKDTGKGVRDIGIGTTLKQKSVGVVESTVYKSTGITKLKGAAKTTLEKIKGVPNLITGKGGRIKATKISSGAGKKVKFTKPTETGQGVISVAGTKTLKAEVKTGGLEVPLGRSVVDSKPIKNYPKTTTTRIAGLLKRRKEGVTSFEGGQITKARVYKDGRITYIAPTNIKGLIYNVKPKSKSNLGTFSKATTITKTQTKLSPPVQKSVVEQVASHTSTVKPVTIETVRPSYVGGQGGVLSRSAFYGQGTTPTEETFVVSGIKPPTTLPKLSSGISTGVTTATALSSISSTKLIAASSSRNRQLSLTKQPTQNKLVTQTKTDTKFSFSSASGLRTAQAQRLRTVATTLTPVPPTTPTIVPRVPKTPILFGLPRPPKRLQQSRQGTFNVAVRRYGKFRTIGTGLGLSRAIGLGRGRTSSTLAATFRITPSSKGTFGGNLTTPKGFKKKKDKRGTLFIEQPSLRLSTGKEVSQIQTARLKL